MNFEISYRYLRPLARPFRFEFGSTMTEIAAGARPRYSSVGKIVNACEKANSQFKT